ncbi:hypothetical protein Ciccas_000172 [Cichlidogyrus casuarinus]|uniref:alkaline phosphatase n=1 Tax=Cichlidogyrus casuarinus TaxID=1844966 RepID=A0ABD2QNR7_9PLAT
MHHSLKIICFVLALAVLAFVNEDEERLVEFWAAKATKSLRRTWKEELQFKYTRGGARKRPKNVILVMLDGLGVTTAARTAIYKSNYHGSTAYSGAPPVWETFPSMGFLKTYSLDSYAGDLASGSTAFFHGHKANIGTVGLNGRIRAVKEHLKYAKQLDDSESILRIMKALEWKVGIVTNGVVTAGTIAPLFACNPLVNFQVDSKIPSALETKLKDTAFQLLQNSNLWDIVLGGGSEYFYKNVDEDFFHTTAAEHCLESKPSVHLSTHMIMGNVEAASAYVDFEESLTKLVDEVNFNETLLIVTSTTAPAFLMSGAKSRLDPLFNYDSFMPTPLDGVDFNGMFYASGPKPENPHTGRKTRMDYSNIERNKFAFAQESYADFWQNLNSGEDVPIFAKGPFQEVFRGVHDNTFMYHAIKWIFCISPFESEQHCC